MVKRFLATKGWILISVTVMSSTVIIVMYDRFRTAEKNLADYRLAISCPSKDNCREKFEAKILDASYKRFFILMLNKHGSTASLNNVSYIFSIMSPVGEQTVEISANPPTVGTPFDIGNVQIPPDSGSKFIQENFHNGETVFIELWRNQVIFLFVDTIINFPEVSMKETPFPESTIPQATLGPLPSRAYEIAMPTSVHPILLHATAQYDFYSATLLCVLITSVTFISVFKKE